MKHVSYTNTCAVLHPEPSAQSNAIAACAIRDPSIHREAPFKSVMVWSLDNRRTSTSTGIVKKYSLQESQGVLFT
jgi:hypothetical protein